MTTRLDIPHTKDPKKWGQMETEEHQSALSGDTTCYFCLATLKAEREKELNMLPSL